jgi:hypothetical protein
MAAKDWERRPDESTKAYEGFAIYRDLGTRRSIEAAWKLYIKQDKKTAGYFGQWAADFDWVARAAAYDDYIDREARKKLDRDAIRRKADMLKRHADTGKALQAFGLQHVRNNQTAGPLRSSDAIAAIAKGVEIERKSEGLPEYLVSVMDATDDDLVRQYNELLSNLGTEPPNGGEPEV